MNIVNAFLISWIDGGRGWALDEEITQSIVRMHRCQHYRFRAYTRAFLAPSRFSLKMSHFFLHIWCCKKCALCAPLSVKWNSDDSATSFQCSAKLIRSAKLLNFVCFACDLVQAV